VPSRAMPHCSNHMETWLVLCRSVANACTSFLQAMQSVSQCAAAAFYAPRPVGCLAYVRLVTAHVYAAMAGYLQEEVCHGVDASYTRTCRLLNGSGSRETLA
jgi:hypothetical protein